MIQHPAIDQRLGAAARLHAGNVFGVRREDLRLALPKLCRRGAKRLVFRLARSIGEHGRSGARAGADAVHQGLDVMRLAGGKLVALRVHPVSQQRNGTLYRAARRLTTERIRSTRLAEIQPMCIHI